MGRRRYLTLGRKSKTEYPCALALFLEVVEKWSASKGGEHQYFCQNEARKRLGIVSNKLVSMGFGGDSLGKVFGGKASVKSPQGKSQGNLKSRG